ncbi:lysocardiolipin acyltransferase 1 isoform X1 [Ciona intestinalis]
MKVVVSGDCYETEGNTTIIMNHRTRLDWIYLFGCLFRGKILHKQKIVLKSQIKWIPGIGWSMQTGGGIFLDRNWDSDQTNIVNMLDHFNKLESNINILFFPEGTDFSEQNKMKSNKFATKVGLPRYEHVLHPRVAGLNCIVNHMRESNSIDAIYDITVAYSHDIPQSESDIIMGGPPKVVHFHIRRYPISEVPVGDVSSWCRNVWQQKENLLHEFYSEPDPSCRGFGMKHEEKSNVFVLILGFIFWVLFSLLCTYMLLTNLYVRCYFVVVALFFISATYLFGGIEKLQILFLENFHKNY